MRKRSRTWALTLLAGLTYLFLAPERQRRRASRLPGMQEGSDVERLPGTPEPKDTASPPAPPYTDEEWRAMVRRAAYLRAERRGFANGTPRQDWLEAEEELRRALKDGRMPVSNEKDPGSARR